MSISLDNTVDDHGGVPDLARMHAEALGSLGARGIRGSAGRSEATDITGASNRVTVDITASSLRTGRATLAETENGTGLLVGPGLLDLYLSMERRLRDRSQSSEAS